MNQIKYFMTRGVRRLRWPLLSGLLCLGLARAAVAADSLYQVDYPVLYVDDAPMIHATNFVNNAGSYYYTYGYWFEVDFAVSSEFLTFFETWDTLNYTNNGVMVTDTGFKFDTQVTNSFGNTVHKMAANFFNPGIISCASAYSSYYSSYLVSLPGECIVSATNISMPGGTVIVGAGGSTTPGLIAITGQNVDLSSSTITLESSSGGSMGSVAAIPNDSSYYYAGFGTDTNAEWNPFQALTASNAYPSLVRMGNVNPARWYYPFGDGYPQPGLSSPLALPTTPYAMTNVISTNNIIYRYVFVANSDPSVTFNVYMDSSAGNRAGSGGTVTVEYVGSYVSPGTGLPGVNYLYITDDYLQGVANNLALSAATGIPNNFSFAVTSLSQSPGTPLSPALDFNPFLDNTITNQYSYADVECVPTTVVPTPVSNYTNNYLAVMPGRILINASSNLDISDAAISGQNYLSLTTPNLVMSSPGSVSIASPYADINVGVSAGSLVATNLLEPSVPAWSGYAQAWSTRWTTLITNSVITYTNGNVPIATNSWAVTNDYRVAIVANQAHPTSPTAVWDLSLHSPGNIVISDEYNILNGLYLDCVGLTLTTNGPGAQSPMGMLNLQGTTNSWAVSTPNLRYLTNYGSIYLPLTGPYSIGIFGTPGTPYGALLNYGIIEDAGSVIWADNFVNGGIFYNIGQFTLNSRTATFGGGSGSGYLYAGGDVSITTGSLIVSNAYLEAYRSLTISATNQFTDSGVGNGGFWYVGEASIGNGIKVLAAPPVTGGTGYGNSLLGTSIELFAPTNRVVQNVWAGRDYGPSPAGFTNNLAVGQLYLDSLGPTNTTRFVFSGNGVSNALYVDNLVFLDQAALRDDKGNPAALNISSNLVIYYANAMMDGVSVAQKLDGKANGHLRWVPTYAGYFSSTTYVYNGVAYSFNTALAQSSLYDSDGDGLVNSIDPMPFFVSGMVNLQINAATNPPNSMALSWNTPPLATNSVFFSTNNAGPFDQQLTNFISPQPYPGPAANVTIFDPMVTPPRYYRVMVSPWLTYPY